MMMDDMTHGHKGIISIQTKPANNPLFGQSKWWGEPDMPEELDWPEVKAIDESGNEFLDPLTFVCQIRCEDIASFDPEGWLPHKGMLYFFAALDYFLGDIDTPIYPGIGQWRQNYFRVLFSPNCEQLHTHHLNYPDGTSATLPAEAISFLPSSEADDGNRLLGYPYIEDVRENMPDMISLLQIEENDHWNLTFHDCGMFYFLIHPKQLLARKWNQTCCYLYSL